MENFVLQQHYHLKICTTKYEGVPFSSLKQRQRPMIMKVKASAESNNNNKCEYSSFNAPLEPRSEVGKFLSDVMQNHHIMFQVLASEELRKLSFDRDSAVSRMHLSHGSKEALLHRRIAKFKEDECTIAIQDIMYLLILDKFTKFGIPLIPKFSSCLHKTMPEPEALPYEEYDLESIHSSEVLNIIREHVNLITKLKLVKKLKTRTISKSRILEVYIVSILFGYFLKSAKSRYCLERNLHLRCDDLRIRQGTRLSFRGYKDKLFGQNSYMNSAWRVSSREQKEIGDLECYLNGFGPLPLLRRGELRSKEAVLLVRSHCKALFGSKDDMILTSFDSMKRLILEAIAFGSFLWDTEAYIDTLYKLQDIGAK